MIPPPLISTTFTYGGVAVLVGVALTTRQGP